MPPANVGGISILKGMSMNAAQIRERLRKKKHEDPLEYIQPALRRFAVPIKDLHLDPENARVHDRENINDIKNKLKKFKQHRLAIVQKKGRIVRVGNGMPQAARELGWTHLACLLIDESDTDAIARAIEDNRSSEKSTWDYEVLAKHLDSLRDEIDVTLLGWDESEIAQLLMLNATQTYNHDNGEQSEQYVDPDDIDTLWQGMPEFEQKDLGPKHTIKVHFRKQKDLVMFSKLMNQPLTLKTKYIWFPKEESEKYPTLQTEDN